MTKAFRPRKPVDGPTACRAFGNALRYLRGNVGISQEEYAFQCAIERAHMNTIEMGRCNLSLETMMKLLPPLGVSFAEFARAVDDFLPSKHRRLHENAPADTSNANPVISRPLNQPAKRKAH